jgi:cytochrome b involved in lipid metabolism
MYDAKVREARPKYRNTFRTQGPSSSPGTNIGGNELRKLTQNLRRREMLLGITLLIIIFTALLLQPNETVWRMFSFFRKSPAARAADDPNVSANNDKEHSTHKEGLSLKKGQTSVIREAEDARIGDGSPDGTPKAKPRNSRILPPVPSFSLSNGDKDDSDDDDDDDDDDEKDDAPPPSFPAVNSAQRASVPTAPNTSSLQPATNGFMKPPLTQFKAPPPRLGQASRTPPSVAAGLRVPSTGPLPNRGPPSGAGGLMVPQSIATKTPNPRQKVLLKPGHSPLDWANLQKTATNLSGVDRLMRVTPTMLKHFNGRKGRPAWSSYQGKVYNISPYLPFHPGGEGELRRAAGKDGGKLFMEVHPWVNWDNMLSECLVGIMVTENDKGGSTLDEMD